MLPYYDLGHGQTLHTWGSKNNTFYMRLSTPNGWYQIPGTLAPAEFLSIIYLTDMENPQRFASIGDTTITLDHIGDSHALQIGDHNSMLEATQIGERIPSLMDFLRGHFHGFTQRCAIAGIGTTTVGGAHGKTYDGTPIGATIWENPHSYQIELVTPGNTIRHLLLNHLDTRHLQQVAEWAREASLGAGTTPSFSAMSVVHGIRLLAMGSTQTGGSSKMLQISITTPDNRWIFDALPGEIEHLATGIGIALDGLVQDEDGEAGE